MLLVTDELLAVIAECGLIDADWFNRKFSKPFYGDRPGVGELLVRAFPEQSLTATAFAETWALYVKKGLHGTDHPVRRDERLYLYFLVGLSGVWRDREIFTSIEAALALDRGVRRISELREAVPG